VTSTRQEISSKAHVAVVSVCLFATSLFLTAYSSRYPEVARVGHSLVLEVVAPISSIVETTRVGIVTMWRRYVYLIHASQENERLSGRVAELEGKLAAIGESQRENERLRQILSFSAQTRLSGVAARVIGADASGWIGGLVIDRGSRDGIKPGMAVVHAGGVVGQVASTGSSSARVLVLYDHSSGVDAIVESSRARGVLEGVGEVLCELKFVTKDAAVKSGDNVVTSGLDQVYPKGLRLGTVTDVATSSGALFQTIEVKPAVDFSRVEEVLVLIPSGSAAEPAQALEARKR